MMLRTVLAGLFLLLLAGCKKDKEQVAADTSAFYFRGTLDGRSVALSGKDQVQAFFNTRISGSKMSRSAYMPVATVAMDFGKVVTGNDVLGLSGRTFNFINLTVYPVVDIYDETTGVYYGSVDTSNGNYNVKIRSVAFVRTDTIDAKAVDVYVVNGTCNAVMVNEKTGKNALLRDATFNLLMGRLH